jgi:hypothetical protein
VWGDRLAAGLAQRRLISDRPAAMSLIVGMDHTPPPSPPPLEITGIRLRRAVVGVLLLAHDPLSIDDVLDQLSARGLRPPSWHQRTTRKVIAGALSCAGGSQGGGAVSAWDD